MRISEMKVGQMFEPYFSKKVFQIIKISKTKIEYVDLKTGEVFETTKNDSTPFFVLNKPTKTQSG